MARTPAGNRNRKVILRRPVDPPERNDDGQDVQTYDDVHECWAEIRPLEGRELFAAKQAQSEATVNINVAWCRKIAGIDSAWRVREKQTGRDYGITIPLNRGEANEEIDLLCVIPEGLAAYPTAILDTEGEPIRDTDGNLILEPA